MDLLNSMERISIVWKCAVNMEYKINSTPNKGPYNFHICFSIFSSLFGGRGRVNLDYIATKYTQNRSWWYI